MPTLQFSPDAPSDLGLRVDMNRLVAGRMLIQGNPGAGKSWLVRYMLEQTYGAIPHLVLDPEGEFYTLRERYGYVWAGAGDEADVPLHPDTAKVMARRFVEVGASVVLDLYELSLGDRREFVARFCDELVHLPKRLWRPLLVILDEAHQYAPQQGSVVSSEAVISLCTLGRKRGFTPVMATQRMAKLDKDAVASLQNKFVGRTDLDNDVRRAADHLGLDKEGRHELRHLEPGTFFSYGPALEADGVVRARSGDVQTTHPEPGEITPSPPPPPDEVRDMLGQLEGMAEEAEEEERTIEALREKVAELRERCEFLTEQNQDLNEALLDGDVGDQKVQQLRAELREELEGEVREELEERIARASHDAAWGVHERWEQWADEVEEALAAQRHIIDRLEQLLEDTREERAVPARPSAPDADLADIETAGRRARAGARPDRGAPSPSGNGDDDGLSRPQPAPPRRGPRALLRDPEPRADELSRPQQRILNALATLEALGEEAPPNEQLAPFAGYSAKSGHYENVRGRLSSTGLLHYPESGHVQLTETGRRYATAASIESLEQVHRLWFALISGPQERLLRVLVDVWPDALTNEELASRAGYSATSGHYENVRGRLSSAGALEYPEPGLVRATEILFPEALLEGAV